ncbi:MAG TPA: phage holin family protein [Allosphingosinicella sp.]|nr:phage holin family protein [Allosphingosinicella sp.]
MDPHAGKQERSIGELFGQLSDDARSYAAAEAKLYQAIARRRVGRARNGAIALVVAVLLANAALSVLLIGLLFELALHVGPALAGLIVTAIVLVIAFLLVRYGAAKLGALGGDAEERAALQVGEKAA